MKYLKKFNESIEDIDSICEKYGITNYTIENGLVNVDNNVYLDNKGLKKLPLKFGIVTGNFYCSGNHLTSLEGCPSKVGGAFNCAGNYLTSLEGCPSEVVGSFYCFNNKLTSLKGCPTKVGDEFDCSNNQLTSLEGCPIEVGGNFNCNYNIKLTSLEYCSQIGNKLYCHDTSISKWWRQINDINKLDAFLDMNIYSDDPDEINQQKIDYILNT